MFVVRYRFGLVFFKDEEFTEVKHLFAQDDTGTGFCDLAFQQTLVVLVVEELDVAGSAAVETVFDRNVVDELLRLSGVDILSGRNTSAQYDTDPVVVEPLGEAEGEVCPLPARSCAVLVVLLHAQSDIHGLQGATRDIVDLALQEAVQGSSHIEARFLSAAADIAHVEVHPCDKHRNGDLRALSFAHLVQFLLHGLVFRCGEDKLQLQVLQRLFDRHTDIEGDQT